VATDLDSQRHSIPSISRRDILQLSLLWGFLAGFVEAAIYYRRAAWSPIAPDMLRAAVTYEPLLFLAVGVIALAAGKPDRRSLMRFHFVICAGALFAWVRLAFPSQSPLVAVFEILPFAALIAIFLTRQFARWSKAGIGLLGFLALISMIAVPIKRERHEAHELARLPSARPGAPNVLLIVVDTLRADHMSIYGYARQTSPFMARLASGGVLFQNAMAASSWTLPSHATMLTGLYPHQHHATTDASYVRYSLPTVGDAFEQAGYRTAAFSANTPLFGRRVGFGRGFIHFEDDFQCGASSLDRTYWGDNVRRLLYRLGIDRDVLGRRRAVDINQHALRWMDSDPRPFFVVLNYFDTHDPYLPPEPFRHLYTKVKNAGWYSSRSWVKAISPQEQQEAIDTYDGAINYVDDELSKLIAALKQRGLDRNTVVVITSDHGESFNEHGFMDHGNALYRELIRVPLIVWAPGRVPAGRQVNTPVSLAEMPATLLDLAGARTNIQFPGPALAALWSRGRNPSVAPPISELAQLKWNARFPNYYGPMESVTTAEWHYISGGEYGTQLFRCCQNDVEQLDLAPTVAASGILQRMSQELVAQGAFDPFPPRPLYQYHYASAQMPESVIVADFNDDGNPDISIRVQDNPAGTVLLGDGAGHFSPASGKLGKVRTLVRAGLEARGDLDGDGSADSATADPAARTVRFDFRRNGRVVATSTLHLDWSPDLIALADVNRNGKADLIVASRSSPGIRVLLSGDPAVSLPSSEAARAAR